MLWFLHNCKFFISFIFENLMTIRNDDHSISVGCRFFEQIFTFLCAIRSQRMFRFEELSFIYVTLSPFSPSVQIRNPIYIQYQKNCCRCKYNPPMSLPHIIYFYQIRKKRILYRHIMLHRIAKFFLFVSIYSRLWMQHNALFHYVQMYIFSEWRLIHFRVNKKQKKKKNEEPLTVRDEVVSYFCFIVRM